MLAIKGKFDGKDVHLPPVPFTSECSVIVVFEQDGAEEGEQKVWTRAQEVAFAKVWENDEDSAYDNL